MSVPAGELDLPGERGQLWRRLSSGETLGVRRGEGRLAVLFFLYFFLLMASHYAVKSVRQSSYIDIVGATNLPYVYLLLALLSFPALVLYSKLTRRFDDAPLIVAFAVFQVASLAVFFWLFEHDQSWLLAFAFYIWATLALGVAVSQVWSFADSVFDARQARRLFAVIGAGGLLGGIPGGQVARLVSTWAGTRYTLLAAGALLLVVAGLALLIDRARPPSHPQVTRAHIARVGDARGGWRVVVESRLLCLIALLMALTVVVGQAVDLQFNWAVEQHTTHLDERTGVMGNFFSLMGLVGFVFQLAFTQRIHRALGVGFGMRVLPVTVGVTTVLLGLSFGLFPAAVLVLAWLLRLSETSLRHSIEQSTRELLFLPVEHQLRRRAKAFVDVFVQRSAKGAGGLLLLPVTFGLVGVQHAGWLTLSLVLIWLWVTVAARREYVSTFRSGLKSGISDRHAEIDPQDLTTIKTLVHSLGSADPRQVKHSLELLLDYGQADLVPPLLLHHPDPEVRRKTLEVLARANRLDALPLIERTISDDSPEVRSAAISTVAALRGEEAVELMLPRLTDPGAQLRAAAVACLAAHSDDAVASKALDALGDMLSDEDPHVRLEAAKALGEIREPTESGALVLLLYDHDPTVVREAIAAVCRRLQRDGENPIYIPTLISLMADRRLKHAARAAVVAFGERAIPTVVAFMENREEQIWVRRALPKTLALLGGESALAALGGLLSAQDAILREKVVEAIVYLRSHQGELRVKPAVVHRQIRLEVTRYLRSLTDLWAVGSMHETQLEGPTAKWRSAGRVPTLLQELLAQRMAMAVKSLASLLELLYPPHDVRAAFRSLSSPDPHLRARALEYLDNTLNGSLRREVFAVVGDTPAEEKINQAAQELDIARESPEQTVERLVRTDVTSDPSAVGLVLAAMHAVHVERFRGLHPVLAHLASCGADPRLRETATWVLARDGGVADPSANAERLASAPGRAERETGMAAMAHIELIVFLQGVDLFRLCTADQLVQLAAIAHERVLDQGEVVYRRGDPSDSIFCLVDGRVELRGEGGERQVVGSGERFGVVDILSGRLRTADAVALASSRAVTVDADDFFDLLSNNVDIVKALFRQLVQQGEPLAGSEVL